MEKSFKSRKVFVIGLSMSIGLFLTLGTSIGIKPVWGYGSLDNVVRLNDDNRGPFAGWDPGITFRFNIKDSLVKDNSVIMISVDAPGLATGPVCSVTYVKVGIFTVGCTERESEDANVPEGASLNYAVINPPPS